MEYVFPIDRLMGKEAYDGSGHRIGLIEAVGMGRDRVPRRIGVRLSADGPALKFFTLAGARPQDGGVVLRMADSNLRVPAGRAG